MKLLFFKNISGSYIIKGKVDAMISTQHDKNQIVFFKHFTIIHLSIICEKFFTWSIPEGILMHPYIETMWPLCFWYKTGLLMWKASKIYFQYFFVIFGKRVCVSKRNFLAIFAADFRETFHWFDLLQSFFAISFHYLANLLAITVGFRP